MSQSKKPRVIESLLSQPSVSAAAAAAGVDRKTVQRLLRDDDFRQRLREARGQAFDQALSRASAAAGEAVDVLLRGLRGENVTRVQLWAAKSILELAADVREDDTIVRVERLEQAVRERQPSRS